MRKKIKINPLVIAVAIGIIAVATVIGVGVKKYAKVEISSMKAADITNSTVWKCGDNFTDNRNGKVYPTVQIGDQCWMAKNLDYDNGCSTKIWKNIADTGWCGYYFGGPFPNEGLLYQWSAAMNGSTTAGAQGICPEGWHVPTDAEQYKLEKSLAASNSSCSLTRVEVGTPSCVPAGTALKSGGNSGFNAIMTGAIYPKSGADYPFSHGRLYPEGHNTTFWSSTREVNNAYVLTRVLQIDDLKLNGVDKGAGVTRASRAIGLPNSYSVRCINNALVAIVAPITSPDAGVYASVQSVNLSTATEGATIYYTLNGTTPTASSAKYAGAISIASTKTIKAKAVKDGASSPVVSKTFTINLPTHLVGGSISGLPSGTGITILASGGRKLTDLKALGYRFTFREGDTYEITVVNPIGYVCTVSNASGIVGKTDMVNANIVCVEQ